MQDINHESKSTRGSSPPFQESENWIDDGANGSHWVKMASSGSQQGDPVKDLFNQESGIHSEDGGRWEDDGGGSMVCAFI